MVAVGGGGTDPWPPSVAGPALTTLANKFDRVRRKKFSRLRNKQRPGMFKMFLKVLQISQETPALESLFNKVVKDFQYRFFLRNL